MIKKILLVDDEEISTLFLSAALSDDGYDIKSSGRAKEAIEIGTAFKPDLLLADWILKDTFDGLDVAKQLRSVLPEMEVIFLTGLEQEAIKGKASEIPHLAIMQKPLDFEQLAALIKSVDEKRFEASKLQENI